MWEHIDLQAGTIALPSRKGGGRRAHPVNTAALSIIAELPKTLGSEWLLPRESDPQRHLSREVLESTWQKVRYHAKLEDVRLHDLRHTVGTFASQAGGNAFLISHLLRRRNINLFGKHLDLVKVKPCRLHHHQVEV
ncbi:tyrosine-type recombinase/integrase [Hoeflea sp. CAU 1731]